MLEDTFESMDDQGEMEEAAEMEIDKILFEITAGALSKAKLVKRLRNHSKFLTPCLTVLLLFLKTL